MAEAVVGRPRLGQGVGLRGPRRRGLRRDARLQLPLLILHSLDGESRASICQVRRSATQQHGIVLTLTAHPLPIPTTVTPESVTD